MTVRATIAAILAGLSMSAYAIADSPKPVDIPAGELRQALLKVSEQFGADLVFSPEQVRGLKTSGARGQLTTEQAVTRLLEGTPLELRTDPSGAMLIAPPSAAKEAPRPSASAGEPSSSLWSRLRVAQTETPSPSRGEGRGEVTTGEDEKPAHSRKVTELQEIVVTGSHIRGSEAIGSRVVLIDREEIDNSGYTRIEDFLRTVPSNFNGLGELYSQPGPLNFNAGGEVQLRGLGPGTTLTLVDGHRQPAGGFRGAFVDVSNIPIAAIERIEILSDGASALYGSDAIGGVVNIILRKDFQGAETTAMYGTADGDAGQSRVSQLLGTHWGGGHALLGYQYSRREQLLRRDRAYTATSGDLRAFGGDDIRLIGSNPGTIVNDFGLPLYAIPAGQDGTNLSAADFVPGSATTVDLSGQWLLPRQTMHGAFAHVSQDLGDDWNVSADVQYSRREAVAEYPGYAQFTIAVPSTNPFYVNPGGGTDPVLVAYDFTRDLGPVLSDGTVDAIFGNIGASYAVTDDWKLTANVSYGRERNDWSLSNQASFAAVQAALADTNPLTALNVFGDGSYTNPATLAGLRNADVRAADSTVWSPSIIADGPLANLPGGVLRAAVGVDYRSERIEVRQSLGIPRSEAERNIRAAFAQVDVPIVGESNGVAGVRRLQASLAVRRDDYSDFGGTTNPKFGLSWMPLDGVALRGTWGKSFRAPPLYQVSESFRRSTYSVGTVADPRSATGFSRAILLTGNNPDLLPETAKVWSAGIDFQPKALENLSISLSYFDIDYRDQIGAAPNQSTILRLEDQWAAVIERNPSPERLSQICSVPPTSGNCSGTIGVIIDARLRNIAVIDVNGIDADVHYTADTGVGSFGFQLKGTYTLAFDRAVTERAPVIDVLDTMFNPISLRLRGSATWTRNGWNGAAAVNYIGGYHESTVSTREIGSWTTVDLGFGYEPQVAAGLLSGIRLQATLVNVADERPPFVNMDWGHDPANADILGRLISVQLTKAW